MVNRSLNPTYILDHHKPRVFTLHMNDSICLLKRMSRVVKSFDIESARSFRGFGACTSRNVDNAHAIMHHPKRRHPRGLETSFPPRAAFGQVMPASATMSMHLTETGSACTGMRIPNTMMRLGRSHDQHKGLCCLKLPPAMLPIDDPPSPPVFEAHSNVFE